MDLSQVTLTMMRYAIAISETGSFRLAAESSHVSQSGLSMQIQKLEEQLGVYLFDRKKKPLLTTDEGKVALKQMRAIVKETEKLGQLLSEAEEVQGPYRLGVIPTLSPTTIPLFLKEFVANYPKVELSVEELTTEEILRRLEADELDAGLVATPLGVLGMQEHPLALEELVVYLPPNDPLLKKKAKLSEKDLKDSPLWLMGEGHCFRSQVLRVCESLRATTQPPVAFESGNFQTLIRLIDQGLGVTLLPELVLAQIDKKRIKSQVRYFRSPVPVREIGLITSRALLRKKTTEALVQTIKAALEEHLPPQSKRHLIVDPSADSAG